MQAPPSSLRLPLPPRQAPPPCAPNQPHKPNANCLQRPFSACTAPQHSPAVTHRLAPPDQLHEANAVGLQRQRHQLEGLWELREHQRLLRRRGCLQAAGSGVGAEGCGGWHARESPKHVPGGARRHRHCCASSAASTAAAGRPAGPTCRCSRRRSSASTLALHSPWGWIWGEGRQGGGGRGQGGGSGVNSKAAQTAGERSEQAAQQVRDAPPTPHPPAPPTLPNASNSGSHVPLGRAPPAATRNTCVLVTLALHTAHTPCNSTSLPVQAEQKAWPQPLQQEGRRRAA